MDDTTEQQQQYNISRPMPSDTMQKNRNVHPYHVGYYVGACLCFVSELIHLWLLPQQYKIFLVYGIIFLFITMAQGFIGANLLFEPRRRLLSFGLLVNALIVILYIFTHTIGVLVGLAFLPLPIDTWGIGATLVESAAVVIFFYEIRFGHSRSRRPPEKERSPLDHFRTSL